MKREDKFSEEKSMKNTEMPSICCNGSARRVVLCCQSMKMELKGIRYVVRLLYTPTDLYLLMFCLFITSGLGDKTFCLGFQMSSGGLR